MTAIIDHIPGSVSEFLDNFQPADGEGTKGEALLAVALGSGSADARKRAKAMLKKCKQPRLNAALKALPRRVYDNSNDTIAADLELLTSMGGVDVPSVAFHLVQLHWSYEAAWPFCAAHVPESYVRQVVTEALEKDPASLRLGRALPSESLFPVLRELRGIEVLYLNVADDCSLLDLRHLKDLKNLGLTGPVTELPAASIEGLTLESLYLEDTGIADLTALSSVPTLEALTIRGGRVAVIGPALWPKLTTMQLRDLPDLKALPAFGELGKLGSLEVGRCGVEALPEDIGACEALEEISLSSLPLRTLPESLGRLRLKKLHLSYLHLNHLPTWQGATPPDHSSQLEVTFESAPSPGASAFLKLPSSATLAAELVGYLDHSCMAKGPHIQAALSAWQRGEDLAAAKVPELLVAIRRTYHDEEHGPSTNRFLAELVDKLGGPVERAASELLPKTEARSASTIHADVALLASVPGFDAQAYEAFASEAVGR